MALAHALAWYWYYANAGVPTQLASVTGYVQINLKGQKAKSIKVFYQLPTTYSTTY